MILCFVVKPGFRNIPMEEFNLLCAFVFAGLCSVLSYGPYRSLTEP
jgi:hypothetical protein